MRVRSISICVLIAGFGLAPHVNAQEGPFSPDDWPKTADPDAVVHYVDSEFLLSPPGDGWIEDGLRILSGGDQVTTEVEIAGVYALKVSVHMNVADDAFEEWADHEVIDILMLVYGNSAVLGADGQPRNFQFLTGTLPEIKVEIGGLIPVEGRNQKWNWVLFRIPNGTRGSDGTRLVGSIPDNAQGSYTAGGVNGGTIRLQPIPGLIVRAVAFGEKGAFGEPEQVNVFFPDISWMRRYIKLNLYVLGEVAFRRPSGHENCRWITLQGTLRVLQRYLILTYLRQCVLISYTFLIISIQTGWVSMARVCCLILGLCRWLRNT